MKINLFDNNGIKNIIFNLYFISVLVLAISGNNLMWHLVMILGVVFGVLSDEYHILNRIFLMMSLCLITGLFNLLLIGNLDFSRILLIALSWLYVPFVENTKINTKLLRVTVIIINLYLIYRVSLNGFTATSFFKSQSYNYISVYALMPAVMYYLFAEKNMEKLQIWPAILTAITCLLGYGRGGIISGLFLAVGVIVRVCFLNGEKITRKKLFLFSAFIVVLLAIIFAYSNIQQIKYLEKLADYGLNSRGRSEIWSEYIKNSVGNIEYLLFGTPSNSGSWLWRYDGNVHNSFLNVHMLNGVFVFVWFIYSVLKSFKDGFIYKRWMYLLCLLTLLLRGFTDNFIWGSFSMVLILIIFYERNNFVLDASLLREDYGNEQ